MSAPDATDTPKLSILLPVRNEGPNLGVMVKMLRAMVEVPHEVLVVYDDEDDDTVPAIAALAPRFPALRGVHNRLGRGVVNALRSGVAAARGEYLLIFAADEVGPVLAVEDMIALMDDGCDLVSCTRYALGGRRLGGSWIGGLLSRAANSAFRLLAGGGLSDCTTGIKMFRPSLLQRLELAANPVGWAVAFELSIKVQRLGLQLGEVPIVSIDRLYGGTSTFRLGPWLVAYARWFAWGVRELRAVHRGALPPIRSRIPANIPPDDGSAGGDRESRGGGVSAERGR